MLPCLGCYEGLWDHGGRELLDDAGTEHDFKVVDVRKGIEHKLEQGGLLSIMD